MTRFDPDTIVNDTIELIPLPQAYFRLRSLLSDPVVSADEVAQVIANDPALTARLLQIANSAYFGLTGRVETVARAVSILGNEEIHSLALAVSAVRSFSTLDTNLVDINEFWRRSVHCAVISRALGSRFGAERAEMLFVAGLLHGIGHIVLCQQFHEDMHKLLSDPDSRLSLPARQREHFGFDYAELGAALLHRWNLPETLCNTLRFHTQPAKTDSADITPAFIHIAAVLTESAAWTPDCALEPPELDPVAFQLTGIEPHEIESLLISADEQVAAALQFIVPDSGHAGALTSPASELAPA